MFNKYVIITTILCITGCSSLAPDYKNPTVEVNKKWVNLSNNINLSDQNLQKKLWWNDFNDPILNKLINLALKENNNIQISIGRILEAHSKMKEVSFSWLPTSNIEINTSINQLYNPKVDLSNSALNIIQNGTNLNKIRVNNINLISEYNINIFQNIKSQNIANLNIELQKTIHDSIKLSIIQQVTSNYLSYLGFKKQLQLQNTMLKNAKTLKKHLEIKYQLGNTSLNRIITSDQLISSIQNNIPPIHENINRTQNALRLLVNKNPGNILTSNDFDRINTNIKIPINLPSTLIKTRPDILISEYELKIKNTEIALAASRLFPSVNLTGIVGNLGYYFANIANFTANLIGISASMGSSVFNLDIYAKINTKKSQYYSAYFNYINTVRTAFFDVENTLSNYKFLGQQYQYTVNNYESAYKILNLVNSSYELGKVDYTNVLFAKLNMDDTKTKLNKIKIQKINAIISLYTSLGVGYDYSPNKNIIKKFNDGHDI